MLKVDTLRARVPRQSFDDFIRECPFSVLVARKILGGLLRENRPDPRKVMEARMAGLQAGGSTMLHVDQMVLPEEMDPTEMGMLKTRPIDREVAFELEVQGRGQTVVSIGRTAVSDVVVNDYTISKRHAVLTFDATARRYTLADAGSTNGTMVGTVHLERDQTVMIENGYWVTMGRLVCQFYTPRGFYNFLQPRA